MGLVKRLVALVSLFALVLAGTAPALAGPPAGAGPQQSGGSLTFVSPSGSGSTGGSQGAANRPSYLPINGQALAHSKALANESAAAHAGGQTSVASPSVSEPLAGPSWGGQYETDLAPPDPTGAIGPSSYIELINLRYGIYDRSGSLISQGTMQDLTGLPQSELSDPQIAWDPDTGLFYYTILDFNTNKFGVGWSLNDHPQSAADFCKYVADFGYGSSLPDYPKLGMSKDFLLIGSNVFLLQLLYTGSDVAWISKPSPGPLSSCPDPGQFKIGSFKGLTNANGSAATTPVPAVQTDPSGTGWVVAAPDVSTGSANFLTVFSVTKNATGGAVLGSPKTIPVPTYSVPASAPQPNGPDLDTLDGRLERAVSGVDPGHGGKMAVWTAHAVFGGAGSEERWYEIDPVGGTLLQSGKATSSTLSVWNGAISPDRAVNGSSTAFGNSMVMGFNTSSSSDYAAIQMVSKVGVDPQSGFVLVKQSPGPYEDFACSSTCRWGDYSGASPDPLANSSGATGAVWLSGEWNIASTDPSGVDWQTWNWRAEPGSTATATVPAAPTSLGATPGDGVVNLSWTAPVDDGGSAITGYDVLRGTTSGGETLLTSVSGSETTYSDTAVTNGTTYYYEVVAVNAVGPGATSPEVSATPTSTSSVPGAPTGLTAIAGDTVVNLTWTAPADDGGSAITEYRVYRDSVPVDTVTSGTNYADHAVTNGNTYTYEVTAVNSQGESLPSNSVTATPSASSSATVPDAPTGLIAQSRGPNIQLSWTPPADDGGSPITRYDVYRSDASGAETFWVSVPSGTTSYKDTATSRRSTYFYKVKAVNGEGSSDFSNEAAATTK